MPKSIFDLVTSTELAAYWTAIAPGEPPYLGEELWDTQQKLGLNISWIKGASGLPAVLKPSAFDAAAIPRPRIGFDKLSASMPYFKESMYIDEELRQELNLILQTGNQNYIDSVMNRVFNDEARLIRSARITRERMRMMALTTGVISISANGQNYAYDYGVTHKGDAATKWSSTSTADPISDIRKAIEEVYTETGITPKRGLCNGVTWQRLRNNEKIKKAIYVLTDGVGDVSDAKLRAHIAEQLDGFQIAVYDDRYADETGTSTKFVADDVFTLFPEGKLGTFWFGTTPEQSDLMASNVANVSIVDVGVAITTSQKVDPVNVETKVSMIGMPDFPTADSIYIMDTEPS